MRVLVGSFVLFDSSLDGWHLSDLSGDIARVIQQSAPIRAAEIETFFRGVKRTDLSFTVSRPHTDEATTLEELFWHESQIPESGVIQIEGRRTAGGTRSVYLRGKLQAVSVRHSGLRSFISYRLFCGTPRLVAPPRET